MNGALASSTTDPARRIAAGVLANVLGKVYTAAVALVTVAVMVRYLGPELFGVFALVSVIGGFSGLLNLGMGTALSKFLAEVQVHHSPMRAQALFEAALGASVLLGASVAVTLFLARDWLAHVLFHANTAAQQVGAAAFTAAGVGAAFSLTAEVFAAVPAAMQRFAELSIVRCCSTTIVSAGVVLALTSGCSLTVVLAIEAGGTALASAGYWLAARRALPSIRLRIRIRAQELRRLLRFSGPVLAAGTAGIATHQADRALLAALLPVAAVAYYAVPYGLSQRLWGIVSNVTSVVLPSSSELASAQARALLAELYVRSSKAVALLILPGVAVLAALPGQILSAYAGPAYAARGTLALRALAVGFLINSIGHVPYVVAQGVGSPATTARFSGLNALVNIALFALLIPKHGIDGAACAFAMAEAIVIPLFVWRVARLVGAGSPWQVLRACARATACAAPGFAWMLLISTRVQSAGALALVAVTGAATCVALSWLGAVDRKDKARLAAGLRELRRQLRPQPVAWLR